jgi:iron only hydrogenase large subunit-like protein
MERPHLHAVEWHLKHRHDKLMVVQTAPSVRVGLSEEFNLPPGKMSSAQMVAGLRRLGFDAVFDTNFTADLTAVEEASELINRVTKGGPFPLFTSCCPAWVNMCEQSYPELIPNLSSCKSPQQMMGSLVKSVYARKLGRAPEDIILVSVMPCVAKKEEAARPEFRVPMKHQDAPLSPAAGAPAVAGAGWEPFFRFIFMFTNFLPQWSSMTATAAVMCVPSPMWTTY